MKMLYHSSVSPTSTCILVQVINNNIFHDNLLQGSAMAKQLGAEAYLECSAFTSEKSIHSVFRTAAMACINKLQPLPKSSPTRRLSKRLLHLPSKSDLLSSTFKKEKTKSCSVMWKRAGGGSGPCTRLSAPAYLVSGKGGGHDGFIRALLLNPSLTPRKIKQTLRRGGHLPIRSLLNLWAHILLFYFNKTITVKFWVLSTIFIFPPVTT